MIQLAIALFLSPGALPGALLQESESSAGPPASDRIRIEARIDELTQPVVDSKRALSVVVGVLQPDGSRYFRCFGRVKPDGEGKPDENSVYEIGSITKVFTGLLLADAIEDGLVELEDPIKRFLPEEVVIPEDEPPVLLWHLVTHTSGLQRMPGNRPLDPTNPFAKYDDEALYEFLEDYVLDSDPGDRYAYSNLATGLLGHLIARTRTAGNFDALLVDRICKPLQLEDTRAVTPDEWIPRLAAPSGPRNTPRTSWDFDVLAGCGAVRSTAADMLRFAEYQLGRENPRSKAISRSHQMLHRFGEKPSGVAYGWHIQPDGTTLFHNGGTGGYASMMAIDVPGRRAVIVLSSSADRIVDQIGNQVMEVMKGD